jgi:glutamate/tyrosine decarboxylase-like PLP-dependent enzyme
MWEALTAIGTLASAAVIAVTVIMAARQVKLTIDQLEQTRRATQFEAARSVLFELAEPKFVSAFRFMLSDDVEHQEIYMLRSLDRIGTYVKHGLVDGEIVYGRWLTANNLAYDAPATLARMVDFTSAGSARPPADIPA